MSTQKTLFCLKADDIISEHKYSKIFTATYLDKPVAVKYFIISLNNPLNCLQEEARILAQCYSPYIVEYIGEMQTRFSYQIIMEYCPKGSLWGLLDSKKFLPWNSTRWKIALGIGRGIQYLQALNIIHGDLKSKNIVLAENDEPKICDFGSARIEGDTQKKLTGCTIEYTAPELRTAPIQTKYSDIYSYGIILWEMASRDIPFHDVPKEELKSPRFVATEKLKFPSDCPNGYQEWATKCYSFNASSRPLIQEIIEGLEKEQKLQIAHYYQNNMKKKFSFFPPLDVSVAEEAFRLGRFFRLNQRYKKAISYLKQAASANYLPAYLDLYLICTPIKPIYLVENETFLADTDYYKTRGDYANMISSNIEWFIKASETEEGEALYNLARCYELGLASSPRQRDPRKALSYFRLAADKNYAVAQYDLAEFYLKEDDYLENRKPDLEKAEKYFILAADQNLALAQFRLGQCYENGVFGPTNKEKAIACYHSAARLGHCMALMKLGFIYEEKNKQNPNQELLEIALAMYTLASEEGIEEPVKKAMFVSELMEAQKSGNFTSLSSGSQIKLENNSQLTGVHRLTSTVSRYTITHLMNLSIVH